LCPEASLFIHVSLILELKLKMLKGKRSGPRELSLKQPNAELYSQTLKRLSRNTLTVNASLKSATPTLSLSTRIFLPHKPSSRRKLIVGVLTEGKFLGFMLMNHV